MTTQVDDIAGFLTAQMADPETQWSFGTFGALAEFAREADEPAAVTPVSAVTPRGSIRIEPLAELRPFAFETTTKDGWNHRIALCLPENRCAMNGRGVLTELGPDTQALRAQDRGAMLFDLGLGALQADCCVRVANPAVAAQLRAHCGHSVFEAGNPAMGIILVASPHRVFVSRLGRVEVFQPIPPPDGKSPEGPHTHVLPGLLRHRRTHAATEPIPEGFVPCAHIYPAHPAKDMMGRARPFDQARHDAFQGMLDKFGDPRFVALKQRVMEAVQAGADPLAIAVTDQRFARTNVRVTLRQLKAAREEMPALAAWLAVHERTRHSDGIDDPHPHEAHAQ
ncbi:MAG: DUF6925 family protein [Xanthobacteraceae bacterium]